MCVLVTLSSFSGGAAAPTGIPNPGTYQRQEQEVGEAVKFL